LELASIPHERVTRVWSAALRTTAGVLVGAVLVAAFLRLVDVSAVYQRLAHLHVAPALLCGVAFLGAYVVRAMRWRCLLRPAQVSVRNVVAIYQVATFFNWLLPIRGGELAKCLLLRHTDAIPVSRSLAAVGMDKTMDLLPAVGLLVVLPFVGLRLSGPLWVLLLSTVIVVSVITVAVALMAWRGDRVTQTVAALLPARARERVEPSILTFVGTLAALLRQPRVLASAAGLTVLAVSLDALFCLLAFRAVGIPLAVPTVLYGYTFYNLAFILPTPPGQVGSNELVGLLIFSGVFGVNRTGVGAMFVFSHPWTAALMTCSALVCLSLMGLSLRGTLRLARGHRQEGSA